jgi:hypothetical protein
MNTFRITTTLNRQKQPKGPHQIEMTLSATANEPGAFGEVIRAAFEVDILRGFWFTHEDGSTTYCFELDDEKAHRLKEALMWAYFNPEAN